MTKSFWHQRPVLITGHTGFVGAWLAAALQVLGARVHGLARAAESPSLYGLLEPQLSLDSTIADMRDYASVREAVQRAQPEVVFHLAAESLVRRAHAAPVETFATNVMGTVHLLEALRECAAVQSVVIATTDKVYVNKERSQPYREDDELGGLEPYGGSKAAAEIAVQAYRASYFAPKSIGLATARAGNIIGGGDFSPDRLLPDYIRACISGAPLCLRHPQATRPWQFVLEPVRAYLMLAEHLAQQPKAYAEAWNIGPGVEDTLPVGELIAAFHSFMGESVRVETPPHAGPYEAGLLAIDAAKAQQQLGWKPVWTLAKGLERTADWYKTYLAGKDAAALAFRHTEEYLADAG